MALRYLWPLGFVVMFRDDFDIIFKRNPPQPLVTVDHIPVRTPSMHICSHAYTCTCARMHAHTRMHASTGVRMHARTHALMQVRTHWVLGAAVGMGDSDLVRFLWSVFSRCRRVKYIGLLINHDGRVYRPTDRLNGHP